MATQYPCLLRLSPGQVVKNMQVEQRDSGESPLGTFHPHLIDMYIPNVPIQWIMVLLHGGAGGKKYIVYNAGVSVEIDPNIWEINWQRLEKYKTMVVVPQGLHCDGVVGPFNPNGANTESETKPDGIATWSNGFMWSGADDEWFLKDLASWLKQHYFTTPRILTGHSNGGMMTYKMMLENPASYYAYASACGPCPTPTIAPPNIQRKRYYARYSGKDDVIGIWNGGAGPGNHWEAEQWKQSLAQLSVANVTYPELGTWEAGPVTFAKEMAAWGTSIYDFENPTSITPLSSGSLIRWEGGGLSSPSMCRMELVTEGQHSLGSQTKLTRRYWFNDVMNWALSPFI